MSNSPEVQIDIWIYRLNQSHTCPDSLTELRQATGFFEQKNLKEVPLNIDIGIIIKKKNNLKKTKRIFI